MISRSPTNKGISRREFILSIVVFLSGRSLEPCNCFFLVSGDTPSHSIHHASRELWSRRWHTGTACIRACFIIGGDRSGRGSFLPVTVSAERDRLGGGGGTTETELDSGVLCALGL